MADRRMNCGQIKNEPTNHIVFDSAKHRMEGQGSNARDFDVRVVPLMGAELKIDHVTLAGRVWMRCGVVPSVYGNRRGVRRSASNHATEMALASFPDGSYFELMGIQAKADPAAVAAHVWGKFLRATLGPAHSRYTCRI